MVARQPPPLLATSTLAQVSQMRSLERHQAPVCRRASIRGLPSPICPSRLSNSDVARQGPVILILLSDCPSGHGGTAFVEESLFPFLEEIMEACPEVEVAQSRSDNQVLPTDDVVTELRLSKTQ